MGKVHERIFSLSMLGILLANGLVAFMLNIFTMFAIRHTSAYIMTLGGIGKDFALISISITLFGSKISTIQIIGYAVALVGMLLVKAVSRKKAASSIDKT